MATKVKLIETGAVTGNIIPDGGIATGKLADDAVTTIKISDANITHAKLHTSMDLTGKTVTVATAAGSTNTTAAASTAFVQQELTTLIGGAPSTLNDLNELAAAINDDSNYNSTLTTALATKLPLAGGTLTGALTSNSLIKTTGDLEIASTQPRIMLDRSNGSYTWNIYNGDGSGNFPQSTFNIANNAGTAVLTALDSGNVGIGVTAPVAPLHIQFSNDDGGVGGQLIKNTNTGTNSNFASLSTQAVNGTIQGTFGSAHYSTWGNAVVFAGSQTSHPFKIITGNAVRATFDTNGNVGIGALSPNTNVQVYHATDDTSINVNHGTGGSYPKKSGISFGAISTSLGGDATFTGGAGIQAINTAAANNLTEMAFFTTSGGAPTERMRIDELGNVGIGTTNPTGKLHVSGGRAGIISPESSWGQFRVGNTGDGEVGIAYVTGATESDFLHDGDPACAYKVIMGINPYSAGTRNFGIGNDTMANYHTIWTEAGHQEPRANNTFDLGSATKGFRNLYATTVTTAGDVNVGGNIIGDDNASYMRLNAGPGGGGAIYLNGTTRTNFQNHIQYMADVHNFGDVDGNPVNTLQVVSDSELVTVNGNLNVTKPIQTTTDTGTRMYTGLATGSHYNEVGYLILDTNIPGHASSGNANMFSISIEGFFYSQTNGGIVDLNIGCYAGESNYYNASFSGSNIPDAWVTNMWVSTNSSGKVAFIFGTTGAAQDIEVACTKFIQGFVNVNAAYANGWNFKVQTGLTGYSQLTVVRPKYTKKPSFSAGSSGFSVSTGWQTISDSMSQLTDGPTDNYNPTNGRFTPQFPGWYQFNFGGWATYSSSTGQERFATCFAKNGSTQFLSGGNYSAGDTPLAGASQRIYLNGTSDYVELQAYSAVATQWGGSSHWVWWDGYWTGS